MPAIAAARWRHSVLVQHTGDLAVTTITLADEVNDGRQNAFGALARFLCDGEDAERRGFRDIGVAEPLAARLASGEGGTGALGHALSPRRLLDPLINGRVPDRTARSVPMPFGGEN